MPTQTTRQSLGLAFYLPYANSSGPAHDIADPLLTLHTANSHGLVPKDLSEALDTVVAGGNHHGLVAPSFLMSYYGSNGNYRSAAEVMGSFTTVDRHALVHVHCRPRVEDCGFRMLQPHEVGRGMAFPDSYIVLGNKRDQVRQYGNAVTPPIMEMLLQRCVESLQ